jgi:hypothetical protein
MANLLNEFADFPDEQDAIGTMLISYGEIEFALLTCIGAVLNRDMDQALRILFRVPGEGPRVSVADAILRPAFTAIGLGPKWGNALGAVRACKSIRNQYAHCHWQIHQGQLAFMNLDEHAKSPEGDVQISYRHIDGPLIAEQLMFFENALQSLYWLEAEYQVKVGREASHTLSEPKSLSAPLLFIKTKDTPHAEPPVQ